MNDTNPTAGSGEEKYYQSQNQRAKKMLLYLAIFSMIMFFAGLTSAYVVLMQGEFWVDIAIPTAFFYSTGIILVSSLTIKLAVDASKKGDQQRLRMMVILTLLLGFAFAVSQFQGWKQLIAIGSHVSGNIESLSGEYGTDFTVIFKGQELVMEDGKYYFPDDYQRTESLNERVEGKSNTASSFIYALSALHLVHLAGGLLYLIYLAFKTYRVQITAQNNLAVKQAATYWHFLDILWLYLFLFLLFIH